MLSQIGLEPIAGKEDKLTREEKRYVSEELQAELTNALVKAERGVIIEVTFYYNGHYITTHGKLIDSCQIGENESLKRGVDKL